jgi:phosphate:Na+ symporter
LRRFLGRTLRGRLPAFLAGLGVTAVLQSSTATGLMVASLAAGGLVDLVPALAVMLGANVGTTLIVLSPALAAAPGFICPAALSDWTTGVTRQIDKLQYRAVGIVKIGARAVEHTSLAVFLESDLDTMGTQMLER